MGYFCLQRPRHKRGGVHVLCINHCTTPEKGGTHGHVHVMCNTADVSLGGKGSGVLILNTAYPAFSAACFSLGSSPLRELHNVLGGGVGALVNCLSRQAEDALSAEQNSCPFTLETLKECKECVICALSNECIDKGLKSDYYYLPCIITYWRTTTIYMYCNQSETLCLKV